MKNITLFALLFFISASAGARPISSLPGFTWDVVPTNPQCEVVNYEPGTLNRQGEPLSEYPQNAWCKRSDVEKNLLRKDTPEFKLLEGIQDPKTTHIRMAYLSFGNERIAKALCDSLQRGVLVELILDSGKTWPIEQELKNCHSQNFKYYSRGNTGGIGFAHNKVTFFTKKSSSDMEIVIGSGNMTLGTILTHENWHFIKAPRTSYFMSMHECLWEGMTKHAESAKRYKEFLRQCRQQINSPPERGIELFFIPGDGNTLLARLQDELKSSAWVAGASHRFNGRLIKNILLDVLNSGIPVKMVFDDDLFWARVNRKGFGLNQFAEALVVMELEKKGMTSKYVQTNHKERLIHHNKFFVWGHQDRADGAFFGAGNLTNSAFTENFENFYLVTLPEVTEEMHRYQQHLWQNLSSEPRDLPQKP